MGMTNSSDEQDSGRGIGDEDLPEDLQPGEENPLAEPVDDDADRQDMGDPHIDGLGRDEDDQPVPPDTDGSEDAHHGAPDSED